MATGNAGKVEEKNIGMKKPRLERRGMPMEKDFKKNDDLINVDFKSPVR
jgi:hypothetical protein